MAITVRKASREDAAVFLELIQALADYEELPGPDDAAKARLVADAFDTEPPRFEVHLAEDDGDAVGYTITFDTYSTFLAKPTLYLEDLFVRPEARTKGAGSALFGNLVQLAAARGCGRMEWSCLNWNTLAQAFYAKRGAQHLDEWRWYRLTEEEIQRLANLE